MLSAEEMGTMSKNNLSWGIYFGRFLCVLPFIFCFLRNLNGVYHDRVSFFNKRHFQNNGSLVLLPSKLKRLKNYGELFVRNVFVSNWKKSDRRFETQPWYFTKIECWKLNTVYSPFLIQEYWYEAHFVYERETFLFPLNPSVASLKRFFSWTGGSGKL